jgi:fructose-bisphosphate aldolase class I
MKTYQLETVARSLVPPGKGILAADESFPTIKKRFDTINVPSNEIQRRTYRSMLFTTPHLESYISGVILFDETLRQTTLEGDPFPELLIDKGIIPGIKVDTGTKALAGFPGEKITEGLDGLRERLIDYRILGAQFAKWRAVITMGPGLPTSACIEANAHALARYAALSQEAGLVPIVEPEVLMEGDHDLARCEAVTSLTLQRVYSALLDHQVCLEGTLLKPNMVLPGKACPKQVETGAIADATLRTLRRTVPAAVPGIVFLSGGQSPLEATERLNAMNALGSHPWELSFSYGRALQEPALKTWQGQADRVRVAQAALYHRAECNGAARYGRYTSHMEASPVLEAAR